MGVINFTPAKLIFEVTNSNVVGNQAIEVKLEPFTLDATQTYGTKTGQQIYDAIEQGQLIDLNVTIRIQKVNGEILATITSLQA